MNASEASQGGQNAVDRRLGSRQRPSLESDTLAAIGLRLAALPPRQKMTLAMALQQLAPDIKIARSKGYTNDEIAAELTRELSALGLTVSGRSVARLVPRKKTARKTA